MMNAASSQGPNCQKPPDMDLLKSILAQSGDSDSSSEDRSGTGKEQKQTEVSALPGRPKTSRGRTDVSSATDNTIRVPWEGFYSSDEDQKSEQKQPKKKPTKRTDSAKVPQIDSRRHQEYPDYHNSQLEKKYEELQVLLKEQFEEHQEALYRQQVQHTKHLLRQYQSAAEGTAPVTGTRNSRTRRKTKRLVRKEWSPRSDLSTQTDDDTTSNESKPRNETNQRTDEGFILIDATEGTTKKVTFAGNGEAESLTSGDQDMDILNIEREIALKSILKGSINRGKPRRRSTGDMGVQLYTPEPSVKSPRRKLSALRPKSAKPLNMNPKPQPGDHSPDRDLPSQPTDHHLKNTQNPKMKAWLKQKNKLYRKQQAEQRKKQKEKRKTEMKEVEEQYEKQTKIETAVSKWMTSKKKEARLLKKRQRQEQVNQVTPRKTIENAIVYKQETIDLKDGKNVETPVEEKKQSEGDSPDSTEKNEGQNPDMQKKGQNPRNKKVNMKGYETEKCTCGFVENVKAKEEEEEQAKEVAYAKTHGRRPPRTTYVYKRPVSPKKAQGSPKHHAKTKPEGEKAKLGEKNRMKYNDWLKGKRLQNQEKKKKDQREAEERASQSDPEMDRIVSSVARNRVEKIKEGKKRIDTGIPQIDEEANRPLGTPKPKVNSWKLTETREGSAGKEEEDKSIESDQNLENVGSEDQKSDVDSSDEPKKNWLKSAKEQDRPSTSKATGGKGGRVKSAKFRPTSGGRPRSVKATFRTPSPPLPSMSPAPQSFTSTSETNSDTHPTELVPHPPDEKPTSPRPKLAKTPAYQKVKYSQKSWDEFSQHVWDKLNDEERPEPQGCDQPDQVPEHEICSNESDAASRTAAQNTEEEQKMNSKKEDKNGNDSWPSSRSDTPVASTGDKTVNDEPTQQAESEQTSAKASDEEKQGASDGEATSTDKTNKEDTNVSVQDKHKNMADETSTAYSGNNEKEKTIEEPKQDKDAVEKDPKVILVKEKDCNKNKESDSKPENEITSTTVSDQTSTQEKPNLESEEKETIADQDTNIEQSNEKKEATDSPKEEGNQDKDGDESTEDFNVVVDEDEDLPQNLNPSDEPSVAKAMGGTFMTSLEC